MKMIQKPQCIQIKHFFFRIYIHIYIIKTFFHYLKRDSKSDVCQNINGDQYLL